MVAKFEVRDVISSGRTGEMPPTLQTIKMAAVSSKPFDAEGNSDDNSFARWTPNGSLTMDITNPALIGAINVGDQFYLDFTKVLKDIPPAPGSAVCDDKNC